ncbi:hypothetical protein KC19_1G294400 [Ceratodon purpureus]|uniref:Uncharacterized protein n=1 Tax=Ceratodon purpureus TaxID=3225 RepID=A0A8T0JD51_CERPU|nr:hypothetical protein KC19_1G294400 [Ceratodon purpureus]
MIWSGWSGGSLLLATGFLLHCCDALRDRGFVLRSFSGAQEVSRRWSRVLQQGLE